MRRSSAACTVRRKPATVTDSPGAGTTSNCVQGQAGHGFAIRALRAAAGIRGGNCPGATAPLTRQRFGPSFSSTAAFAAVLAVQFAQHLGQDVLDGDDAGGAAEFIQDDGQAALLALEAFEQLQQVHAFRHEGRKLDGQRPGPLRGRAASARVLSTPTIVSAVSS